MVLEISKSYVQKFYNGKLQEAVKQKDGILWTDEKIKNTFNCGNGTVKDLQKHIRYNRKYCYFVEV